MFLVVGRPRFDRLRRIVRGGLATRLSDKAAQQKLIRIDINEDFSLEGMLQWILVIR
ncbi:MAG: hypothetical protein WCP04_12155 [Pseudomonadota bacterium]